jgi:hypothetical protein
LSLVFGVVWKWHQDSKKSRSQTLIIWIANQAARTRLKRRVRRDVAPGLFS